MKNNSLSGLFIHSRDIYFSFSKCKIHEGAKPEQLLDDSCITVHLLDTELCTWKEWILWYVNYTLIKLSFKKATHQWTLRNLHILLGERDFKQTQKGIYNKTYECFGAKE